MDDQREWGHCLAPHFLNAPTPSNPTWNQRLHERHGQCIQFVAEDKPVKSRQEKIEDAGRASASDDAEYYARERIAEMKARWNEVRDAFAVDSSPYGYVTGVADAYIKYLKAKLGEVTRTNKTMSNQRHGREWHIEEGNRLRAENHRLLNALRSLPDWCDGEECGFADSDHWHSVLGGVSFPVGFTRHG